MTLLTICQAVANYAPVAAPSAIVDNSDQTATLLLAIANAAGSSLANRPPGGWVSMIEEYDFVTNATPEYSGTIANVDDVAVVTLLQPALCANTNLQVIGDGTWIANGTGIPNNAIVTQYLEIFVGTPPFLTPTYVYTLNQPATFTGSGTYNFGQSDYALPTDFKRAVDNTFWDRSRYWSMRGPQSPQQWQLYKSSVIGKASIQRRYRFRSIEGTTKLSIDPVPFDNGSALVFEYVSTGWCQSAAGVRQSSWMADTDNAVLSAHLIQLGMTWRLLRRLGLSYNEEMAEYEREVDKALAVDGAAAILDLTPNEHLTLLGPWNLPESGFGNVLS